MQSFPQTVVVPFRQGGTVGQLLYFIEHHVDNASDCCDGGKTELQYYIALMLPAVSNTLKTTYAQGPMIIRPTPVNTYVNVFPQTQLKGK